MALLPVADALAAILDGATPSTLEAVPIAEAAGRVLAEPLKALRTQPPFPASAMDGYAARGADVSTAPAALRVIGMAAAGRQFDGTVGPGEAVRIFPGAPVPSGADTVVIQENVEKAGADSIVVTEPTACGRNVRKVGLDFVEGEVLLDARRTLDAAALSLAAAANHPTLPVFAKPLVAIIATGDELLPPGSNPGPDQIIASNGYGVAAICTEAGARILDLGIVPDSREKMAAAVRTALDAGADVIVTLGGASVGDHDLVNEVLTGLGLDLSFWKIAMRPGKPLMYGRLGRTRCLGLPGNPVSSLVCSHLFLKPLVLALAGRPQADATTDAVLGADMPANDMRQDYVRALAKRDGDHLIVTPFPTQDSSMLRTLAEANALVIRSPYAPAASRGDGCRVLLLR